MTYRAPSTETATALIKEYAKVKAEHEKLGKNRAKQEQLLKLAKELEVKGAKIAGVLSTLVPDARDELSKMVRVVDDLLKQAEAVHEKAKSDVYGSGNADPADTLGRASRSALLAKVLHEKAVAEDKACNEAVFAIVRKFEPGKLGLDEKYCKAFVLARLNMDAEIKRVQNRLDRLEQLAGLCAVLVETATRNGKAHETDEKAAKEATAELAASVGKLLGEDQDALRNARGTKLVAIESAASARKLDPKNLPICLSRVHEIEAAYNAAQQHEELAQAMFVESKRRYAGLALAERHKVELLLREWPALLRGLKESLAAAAKAVAGMRAKLKT